MNALRIIIGVVIYTALIIVLYLPVWRAIGTYPLRYLNKTIQKVFKFNDNKSELIGSATKYIWCTTVLIWMVYFVTPFLMHVLPEDKSTILANYFEYSILLYALITISRKFTPDIIESNRKLASTLKFMSWCSALVISLLL